MAEKVRVLIVDDSAVARQVLTTALSSDPDIEVMGVAADPYIAAEKIRLKVPDVITLDMEMPRMDGLTFLQKIMSQHPIPVVVCSSLTEKGAEITLRALQYGAVDIITKPKMGVSKFFEESKIMLCDAVKGAAAAKVSLRALTKLPVQPKLNADAVIRKARTAGVIETTEKVVAIGASTGGTEALKVFLEALPYDAPGVVVVQHMPKQFTAAFARRLNECCRVTVQEAVNGDTVIPGRVLIAPGNRHLLLKRSGTRFYVEVKDGPLVCRHRPSVDVLFRSAARYAGCNGVGVIMTGMGDDGAKGLLEMKDAGAVTFAQDEASCTVFGMPKEAIRLGAVGQVLPLKDIAAAVMQVCNESVSINR